MSDLDAEHDWATAFLARGFDIFGETSVQAYNASVPAGYEADDFGRVATRAMLVGNTRLLWPLFCEAYENGPNSAVLKRHRDPLDAFVSAHIYDVCRKFGAVRHAVYFSPAPPPRRILMQRAADAAGLAALAPSHLCVHPEFGPWFSLRAFIVVDQAPVVAAHQKPTLPCDCRNGCGPKLAALTSPPLNASSLPQQTWRDFVEMRAACPIGAAYKYSDEQIRFHYAHDRTAVAEWLRRNVTTKEEPTC